MCNTVSNDKHHALILTLSTTTQMGYLSRSLQQHVFIALLQPLPYPGFKIWEQTAQVHHTGSSVSGTPAYRHASCTAHIFAVYNIRKHWPTNSIFPPLHLSGFRKPLVFLPKLHSIHSWPIPESLRHSCGAKIFRIKKGQAEFFAGPSKASTKQDQ